MIHGWHIRAINDMRMCNSFSGFFARSTQTAVLVLQDAVVSRETIKTAIKFHEGARRQFLCESMGLTHAFVTFVLIPGTLYSCVII